MRVSSQLSVALAIGSVSGFAIPTFTLPTAIPTFTLPTFPFPTITFPGLPTSTKTTTAAATTSSSKTTAAGSSFASSIKASSFASSVKASSAVPTISTSVSKPSVVPTTPVGSSSSIPKSSASAAGSSFASSIKASSASSIKASSFASSVKASSAVPTLSTSVSKPSVVPSTPIGSSPSIPKSSASASATPSKPSNIVSSVKPSPTVSPYTYVNTTSGTLKCGAASNVTGVTECLGIPFAQPPVGDLRFAPPVAYTGSGMLDATTYGSDCACTIENVPVALGPRLYGLLGSLAQVGDPLSEDCLFVNVWMKSQKSTTLKPVLVWMYGGGFNFGGSGVEVYSGKFFAQDEDVVLVSLNYRTNILGFSGAPGQTQNVGLLDQRMAIEWVRDNIAAFGGDPSRITLFGQSAGGASVDYYNYIWTEDPIIAGQIPMSGTATSFAARTASQGATSWYGVTTAVGCGNSSTSTDEAIFACMRTANITAIDAAAAADPGLGSLLGKFGPVIDNTTVFQNYTELAVNGNFTKKPTLTGNLNYESGLFILIAAGAGQSYPQSTWTYIDEQVFTCPVSRLALYAADAGVPTWRYYFSGAYPNEILPTANITQAWHTSELPNLFGTTELIERDAGATLAESNNTAPQAALAKYMRHAWVTFASDPEAGLAGSEFGWPQYSASGNNVVYLGQNNQTVAFGPSTDITGPCTL